MQPTFNIALTQGPVQAQDAAAPDAASQSPPLSGMGGECVFLGRTRAEDHPEFGPLRELVYDAYAPMVLKTLEQIAAEVAAAHDCGFIGVRHSIGAVPVGAASVIVRALSGHRGESFAACRAIIDRLKLEAPIWKHERWDRGETWQEGYPVAQPDGARS